MKTTAPKRQRGAIYTRKSTEHNLDLAFNSLDAQREACEYAPRKPPRNAGVSASRAVSLGFWEGLADDTVLRERVCEGEFPGNREISREFSEIRRQLRKSRRQAVINQRVGWKFPTQVNREFFKRNRELISLFLQLTGNLATVPLRAQTPLACPTHSSDEHPVVADERQGHEVSRSLIDRSFDNHAQFGVRERAAAGHVISLP